MGSILEVVLIAIFAATVLAAAATVFSRVVHQAHGTGYP
jgi:TRAP-type C4-dicarboxylate transport system permease small subunit